MRILVHNRKNCFAKGTTAKGLRNSPPAYHQLTMGSTPAQYHLTNSSPSVAHGLNTSPTSSHQQLTISLPWDHHQPNIISPSAYHPQLFMLFKTMHGKSLYFWVFFVSIADSSVQTKDICTQEVWLDVLSSSKYNITMS